MYFDRTASSYSLNRREFITLTGGICLSASCSRSTQGGIDAFIKRRMEVDHIPGLAAALIRSGSIVWSGLYGWADLDRKVPMGLDTLLNIGSISKTFTTTALMQLWEKDLFDLDDDVSQYLPFAVRHPAHTDAPITFRHLLTHRSALRDGPAYSRHYVCGDPEISLEDWLSSYLTPSGSLYEAGENFEKWPPGARWRYCNVAYGLVAYLVQVISATPFAVYCTENVFSPLGMEETSWYLSDIDTTLHAIPYTWVKEGEARGPDWGGVPLGVIGGGDVSTEGGYRANCLYNHPNFPDGFLRSSVRQLGKYLAAYLSPDDGKTSGLLRPSTIDEMLKEHCRGNGNLRIQGLTWYGDQRINGEILWGHRGNDPGINTDVRMVPSLRTAAIVLTNTNGSRPSEITKRILQDFL